EALERFDHLLASDSPQVSNSDIVGQKVALFIICQDIVGPNGNELEFWVAHEVLRQCRHALEPIHQQLSTHAGNEVYIAISDVDFGKRKAIEHTIQKVILVLRRPHKSPLNLRPRHELALPHHQ